jgi:outer membrane protein TolC
MFFGLLSTVGSADSLTLPQAIEMALENSRSLGAAVHDSLAAIHAERAAKADRWPTLSLSGKSFYISDIPEVALPLGPSLRIGSKENYQIDLKLAMPLYTGGRISNQIKLRRENSRQKSFITQIERYHIAYDCRRAYLTKILARTARSSAGASLKRIEIIKQNVENLYRNGLADSLNIFETGLAYQKAERMYNEKQIQLKIASLALNDLLNLPPGQIIESAEKITPPESAPAVSVITDDSIKRYELLISGSRIESARYQTAMERSGYFPTVSGYAGYSYGKPNKDFFHDVWNDNFVIGGALEWQFNLGGRTGSRLDAARHSESSARLSQQRLVQALILQARIAREKFNLAYTDFLIAGREYQLAADKYRLAESKQTAGLITINYLLELETELTSAEQRFRASIINYYLAESEYLYAIGSDKIFGGL